MTDNTKNRGFASENYDEATAEEARRKGGEASASEQDMSELGQQGGQSRNQNQKSDE